MAEKTRTVYHPNDPNVSYDVPEGDVQGWRDQGWRVTEPKQSTTSSTADSK